MVMVASGQVGFKMLDKFKKSLEFLSVDASNMEYKSCNKNVYKFEVDQINKLWLSSLAFYRAGHEQGRIDELNEISIHAIKEIEKIK